jgi:hypothetical protein
VKTVEAISLDETYQIYVNRVARLTLPEAYSSQLQNIHTSPKFNASQEAVAFPGYSITNPPWREDRDNDDFYQNLQQTQEDLVKQLPSGLIIPIPPKSFHVTFADLIWNDDYREAVKNNPYFDQQLRDRVAQSFNKCDPTLKQGKPVSWQLLGLMVRPRAIAVCLVPKSEEDYKRAAILRRCLYQNPDLIALGIEQQYHFTAHVTLGYFGDIPDTLDRQGVANRLDQFNHQWLEATPQVLQVKRVELRKFEDMTSYQREEDYPVLEF